MEFNLNRFFSNRNCILCITALRNTIEWAYPGMFILHKVSIDNIMKDWFLFAVYDSPHFEARYIDECLFLCMNDVMSLCPEDSYVEITLEDYISSPKIRIRLKRKDSNAGLLSSKVHHDVHLASSSLECLSGLKKQLKPHGSFIRI